MMCLNMDSRFILTPLECASGAVPVKQEHNIGVLILVGMHGAMAVVCKTKAHSLSYESFP